MHHREPVEVEGRAQGLASEPLRVCWQRFVPKPISYTDAG